MTAERIRTIRKSVARSARAFEQRFGIPAATINSWEQGRRKPGPVGRLLLQAIETTLKLSEEGRLVIQPKRSGSKRFTIDQLMKELPDKMEISEAQREWLEMEPVGGELKW